MERTALVVDDSKSARFALRRHLEGHAFKVETADCAQEAYRLVQAQRPDLIFLDHIMPGIDGFAAMRPFKQDPATDTIQVVICRSEERRVWKEGVSTCRFGGGAYHIKK